LDLAEEFGISDEVADQMRELVLAAEKHGTEGYDEKTNRDRR
jgi:hypothetical protein